MFVHLFMKKLYFLFPIPSMSAVSALYFIFHLSFQEDTSAEFETAYYSYQIFLWQNSNSSTWFRILQIFQQSQKYSHILSDKS